MAKKNAFSKSRIAREIVKYHYETDSGMHEMIATLTPQERCEALLSELLEQIILFRNDGKDGESHVPDNISDGMLGAIQWQLHEEEKRKQREAKKAKEAAEAARVAEEEAKAREEERAREAEIVRRIEAGELQWGDYWDEISVRGQKVLTRLGIVFISDITPENLWGARNCGVQTFAELMEFRKRHIEGVNHAKENSDLPPRS